MDARYDHYNDDCMVEAESLAAVAQRLDAKRNSYVQREVQSYAWGAQEAKCTSAAPMSMEQVSRCGTKQAKSKGTYAWSK